jgi:hypothetical protein
MTGLPSETPLQNFEFRLCFTAKSSPNCPVVLARGSQPCHPNAAKIIGNHLARKRTTPTRSGFGQEPAQHRAYIAGSVESF